MNILTYPSAEAEARIAQIVSRSLSYSEDQEQRVRQIIETVRTEGDTALVRYTREFDAPGMSLEQLQVSQAEIEEAAEHVESGFRNLLDRATYNIRRFHEAQQRNS